MHMQRAMLMLPLIMPISSIHPVNELQQNGRFYRVNYRHAVCLSARLL